MKKYFLILIGLSSLTLTSFSTENSSIEITKIRNYKVTCPGGAVYYFQCDCGLSTAQSHGELLCNYPISEP